MAFAMARRKQEAALNLQLGALAARGDPKDVKAALKDLQK